MAHRAHRVAVIGALMDALRELHLVRCIAGQFGDFLRLGNDAPCTALFAVQLALCMVCFQQAADGKSLVSILGQRNFFDGAAVGVALPQLHAITGSITLSQEQFLNRTGVSFQRAAGLQLHARNLAGVGVVDHQRSVGSNRKLDIERLPSAALAGILDRQFSLTLKNLSPLVIVFPFRSSIVLEAEQFPVSVTSRSSVIVLPFHAFRNVSASV